MIADTDGALATGTVNVTVLPYVTNALPWRESFESYAGGLNLVGTNGWSGAGMGIVTNLTYPYDGALPLVRVTHVQVLDRSDSLKVSVTAIAATDVYCDMMIRPGYRHELTALGTNVRTAVGVDTNGFLNVWHQTDTDRNGTLDGAQWTQLSNAPLAAAAWARVTLALNNTSDTIHHYRYVQVLLNGEKLSHADAFAQPDGTLQAGGTWFITGGSSSQSIERVTLDGYGYSDDLVIDYGAPPFESGAVYLIR